MRQPLRLGTIPAKNLRCHPVRTVILFVLMVLLTACAAGGFALIQSMQREAVRSEGRLGADILLYPSEAMSGISAGKLLMQGTPTEVHRDRSMLSRLQDCDGIAQVSCQLYLRDTTGDKPIWIVGYDPETDFVIHPWLGTEENQPFPAGTVLAGNGAPGENGGIKLFGRVWPIAARLEKTESVLDDMVFIDIRTVPEILKAAEEAGIDEYRSVDPENDFSAVLIRIREKKDIDSVTNWLNVYVRKMKAVRSEETLTDTASGIRGQMRLIAVIAGAAWMILLLSLSIAQSVIMKERKKELYVWYTVGASRDMVRMIMMKEAMMVYGAGVTAGVLAGGLAALPAFGTVLSVVPALVISCLSFLAGCAGTLRAVKRAERSVSGQMLTV